MAKETILNVEDAVYTGNDLTTADNNAGLAVKIVGNVLVGGEYYARVQKLETGAGAGVPNQRIWGVIQTVTAPGSTRAPTGGRFVSVATAGSVKMKKGTTAPATGDAGGVIIPDVTATSNAGEVNVATGAADTGQGIVERITGTTTDDFIIVNLNRVGKTA